ETKVPKPAATNAPQNWKAGSFEELWVKPLTGATGPTVGDQVKKMLGSGGEVRQTLEDLAGKFPAAQQVHKAGIYLGTVHPQRAYKEGFLDPLVANAYVGIWRILNWAPDYGVASNSADDTCEESARDLDKKGQLGGMTATA